jgi:hypothetical protein
VTDGRYCGHERGTVRMSKSKTRKIKSTPEANDMEEADLFYMDLREVRDALASKYEYLAERYEQQYPKHKGIT